LARALVSVARSGVYRPKPVAEADDLAVMRRIRRAGMDKNRGGGEGCGYAASLGQGKRVAHIPTTEIEAARSGFIFLKDKGRRLKIYETDLNRRLDRPVGPVGLSPTHTGGRRLQAIIKKVRRHLFAFVTNCDHRHNNASERALRPCAVCREITRLSQRKGAALMPTSDPRRNRTAKIIRAFDAIRLTLEGRPLPCARLKTQTGT
jgi:hypothetical protein